MTAKRFSFQMKSMRSVLDAYEVLGNATANGEIEIARANVVERCLKGAAYLGATLPVKLSELILRYKGTPFVDIPLAEAEGKPMLRSAPKAKGDG